MGEVGPDGLDIIGVGTHPSRGLKKGVIVNIDSTVAAIKQAIVEAESMAEVPPAAMGAVPTAPQPNGPEWTPSERPMARAPGTPTVPPGARRQMQPPRPGNDELGVEESEFDKPTYLRRGLYAPE